MLLKKRFTCLELKQLRRCKLTKALIIGRFQPFHLGHEFLIQKALKENDSVTIAIGSSQESRTKKNPFTYEERKQMIKSCFKDALIIPCPDFKRDNDWVKFLESKAKFDTVYSNNTLVSSIFSKKGIKTVKVKRIPKISGTVIRNLIKKSDMKYLMMIPECAIKAFEEIEAEKIILHLK